MAVIPREITIGFENAMMAMNAQYSCARVKWFIGEEPIQATVDGHTMVTRLANGQYLSAHVIPSIMVEA